MLSQPTMRAARQPRCFGGYCAVLLIRLGVGEIGSVRQALPQSSLDCKSKDQGRKVRRPEWGLAAPDAQCLSNEKGAAGEAQTKYAMTKDARGPDLVGIRALRGCDACDIPGWSRNQPHGDETLDQGWRQRWARAPAGRRNRKQKSGKDDADGTVHDPPDGQVIRTRTSARRPRGKPGPW